MAKKPSRTLWLSAPYLKAAVFGAADGIVTTFAVVAGVAGAGLSTKVVLIMGISNLIADGISMAAGDFLGERSEQRLLRRQHKNYHQKGLWKSGAVTFGAFVIAGTLPLIPYLVAAQFQLYLVNAFFTSSFFAACALFLVGCLRTIFIKGNIIRNGLEMLLIGAAAAVTAYGLGALVELWLL